MFSFSFSGAAIHFDTQHEVTSAAFVAPPSLQYLGRHVSRLSTTTYKKHFRDFNFFFSRWARVEWIIVQLQCIFLLIQLHCTLLLVTGSVAACKGLFVRPECSTWPAQRFCSGLISLSRTECWDVVTWEKPSERLHVITTVSVCVFTYSVAYIREKASFVRVYVIVWEYAYTHTHV